MRGSNIRVSRLGNVAERTQGFHKGITFSDRPVQMKERIFIKIGKISKNWQGFLRFGFTNTDPTTLEGTLPKCSVPNLSSRDGFWAKKFEELNCERNDVLFFYVTSGGDVYFGINGKQKGLFIKGIDTRLPLWAIIDVYGNCTAIELLDWRVPEHDASALNNMVEMESNLPKMMQSLSVMDRPSVAMVHAQSNSSMRIPCKPMPFHRTRGRNIVLSSDSLIATRVETEFSQGYVFSARPIRIGEKLIVQVLRNDSRCVGGLAIGLTSCDPATLRPSELPDDSDLLLDRPEYWVVSKDAASAPVRGDEIIFSVMPNGEVQISKNNGPPTVVMHVDQSLTLWAFLDVYGSTQSVRVLSHLPALPQLYQTMSASTAVLPTQRSMPQRFASQVLPPAESVSSIESIHQPPPMPLINHSRVQSPLSHAVPPPNRVISSSELIQLQTGGTVLVVNLPPATSNNNLSAPIQTSTPNTRPSWSNTSLAAVAAQWQEDAAASLGPGVECTICYEKPIDSALYACGHMCMCYDCAVKQWHSVAGGGQCPLCRATIRDVLRIYKS